MGYLILSIVVFGALFLIYNSLTASQKISFRSSSKEDISLKPEKKTKPETNVIAYLSEFDELLKKYNIKANTTYAFFDVLEAIIDEGKNFVKESLKKIMLSDASKMEIAKNMVEKYNELRNNPYNYEINWGYTDINSPKIYDTAIGEWANKFGMTEQFNEKPRETFEKIISEKIFQYGINSFLDSLKVKFEFLEKNLNSGNLERIHELLDEVKSTILDRT